jgi:signal transduction histidine kinase/DNA-binding response OmpR family regulator
MKEALPYFQNGVAFAFVLLGVVTAIGWARRRDRSLGLLALAIILLSVVSLLGSIPALLGIQPPLVPELSLIGFMGSGYALFRFRGSLIPLSRLWNAVAAIATGVAVVGYLVVGKLITIGLAPTSLRTPAAFALIVVWSALVAEPIVRFWIVSRGQPAVQAWRLRSLSLGFAGLVLILLIAIAAGSLAQNPAVQVGMELMALVTVPLLYVSFSPPSWLRRQWRASEEEGLQVFMRDLLLLDADPSVLTDQALGWAMRLAGGAAVVAFDGSGAELGARGLTPDQIAELKANPAELQPEVRRIGQKQSEVTILVLPIASLGATARLVVVAGPFTPGFGADESNRVQQFISAVVSALDRARLLDELRAANVRLQEADRHKSVFLANMSHELRTPLNAILGFSELLIDSSNGQYPAETRTRFLEQINASGKHLLGLINDILDLSKIEAGRMELRLQNAGIAEIVDDVVRTVEPLAAKKSIHIQVETDGAGEIEADAGKLKQMVLNLVSNAIKFTPELGAVTIKALRHRDHVEVSVSDTGIGIADEDRARLFEPFQQVDSGSDRRQQGTGLGLALTRRFARLHGGDVRLESQLGKGSVFIVSLPLQAHQEGTQERNAMPVTVGGGDPNRPLILIVEDNPAATELLSRNLERGGFRTVVARTGPEALAVARRLQPVAITLDILLPELDGWEVLTRLKQDPATSSIPVVVVSVVDNPELGMALGALDYFVKPIDGVAFLKSLSRFNFRRALGREEFRVLVVDDEPGNREMLAGILEPAGFTVISAAGGREAIELATQQLPDLILLDLIMPEVTGFDVVEALRANQPTHNTPIMVLTAKDLTDADKQQLSGQVSTILNRRSTGASDLLGLLRQVAATGVLAV